MRMTAELAWPRSEHLYVRMFHGKLSGLTCVESEELFFPFLLVLCRPRVGRTLQPPFGLGFKKG